LNIIKENQPAEIKYILKTASGFGGVMQQLFWKNVKMKMMKKTDICTIENSKMFSTTTLFLKPKLKIFQILRKKLIKV
jgi:hypothetical protein